MKRNLTHYQYKFLKNELEFLEQNGKLQEGQSEELMSLYEVKKFKSQKNINPVNVILIVGAILIGLSILSFVASNWSEMTKLAKYLLLLFLLIGFYLAGYQLEGKKHVLSKVFYYIGAFAYGAEIFYIGQMFHLGGELETAFLLWGLGILPLGFYLKDKKLKLISLFLIYLFIHIKFVFAEGYLAYTMFALLPIMFAFGHYVMKRSIILLIANFIVVYEFIQFQMIIMPLDNDRFPFDLLIIVPALFYIGHKLMKKSIPLFFANLILALQALALMLSHIDDINFVVVIQLYFVIGLSLFYIHHKDYVLPMKVVGGILHFITAITLTFSEVWEEGFRSISDETAFSLSIIFAILYAIYSLYLVKRGSLFGVAIVCVLILRFYVDLSLAFMDKSIAFFIGGILLIGLGYWFEKTRKGEGSIRVKK